MSRVKGVGASKFGAQKKVEKTQKKPQLEEYISNRDYTGAIALMEFQYEVRDTNHNHVLVSNNNYNYDSVYDRYPSHTNTHHIQVQTNAPY